MLQKSVVTLLERPSFVAIALTLFKYGIIELFMNPKGRQSIQIKKTATNQEFSSKHFSGIHRKLFPEILAYKSLL